MNKYRGWGSSQCIDCLSNSDYHLDMVRNVEIPMNSEIDMLGWVGIKQGSGCGAISVFTV